MRLARRLRRPTYAEAAATAALVLSMSGTAYAVTALPANSVGSAQLRSGAVVTAKLAPSAVSSTRLRAGAVTRAKLAVGAVDGSRVVDESLTLADIAGASQVGLVSFTVAANACGALALSVSGAKAGDAAFLVTTGAGLPDSVVFGPLRITSDNAGRMNVCNLAGSTASITNLPVRLISLR